MMALSRSDSMEEMSLDCDSDWETLSLMSAKTAPPSFHYSNNSNNSNGRQQELSPSQSSAADSQHTVAMRPYRHTSERWDARSKLAIASFLTIVMMLSTVRINTDQTRMTTVVHTAHKLARLRIEDSNTVYESSGLISSSREGISSSDSSTISLDFLTNVSDPVNHTNVPFFFHIPRSGGSTMKNIMGSCYGMVEATDGDGRREKEKQSASLQVTHVEDGAAFVNVDTGTLEGIQRAKALGLVESGLANVVISQLLYPAASLFNSDHMGRCFTMIRHPVERAVSMFHYLAVASWDPSYDPSLGYISIEMYARSQRTEHNWMVRFLSNELNEDVTETHLEVAKNVLRQKCLVGLLEHIDESFRRFETYFGWTPKDKAQHDCRNRLLNWEWSNKHAHPAVEEGSVVWDLLAKKNELDVKLYHFARSLFDEQTTLIPMTKTQSSHETPTVLPHRMVTDEQSQQSYPAQANEGVSVISIEGQQ